MCGIGGIASIDGTLIPNLAGALDVLGRMVAHRGPDGDGVWTAPADRAGLAHRRLAIIDLSDAAGQPMVAPGPIAITYNGEVYNYRELRQGLAAGSRFRSHSDNECILSAYARYWTEWLDRLRGMCGLALSDDPSVRLR